jgi:hypothetical protein
MRPIISFNDIYMRFYMVNCNKASLKSSNFQPAWNQPHVAQPEKTISSNFLVKELLEAAEHLADLFRLAKISHGIRN